MNQIHKEVQRPKWFEYKFSETTEKAIRRSKISFETIKTYDTHTLLSKRAFTKKIVREIDEEIKNIEKHRLPDSNAEEEFLEGIKKDNLQIDDFMQNRIKQYIRYKIYKPKVLNRLGVSEEVLSLYKKVLKR